MGGDTLAGGGAAEGGDILRFTATAAGHGQKIYPEKQKVRRMRTALFHKDDVFIIACCGIRSGRYYPLLRLSARVCGVDARAAISRMAASIT